MAFIIAPCSIPRTLAVAIAAIMFSVFCTPVSRGPLTGYLSSLPSNEKHISPSFRYNPSSSSQRELKGIIFALILPRSSVITGHPAFTIAKSPTRWFSKTLNFVPAYSSKSEYLSRWSSVTFSSTATCGAKVFIASK